MSFPIYAFFVWFTSFNSRDQIGFAIGIVVMALGNSLPCSSHKHNGYDVCSDYFWRLSFGCDRSIDNFGGSMLDKLRAVGEINDMFYWESYDFVSMKL